jgi:hypothetical protein
MYGAGGSATNERRQVVFAGLYALYAGLVFLVASGLVFAPIVHRVLHRFHWERDQE